MEWGNFAEMDSEMKVANQGTERLGVETGVVVQWGGLRDD
jgi:hypothetical protein